ncbi:MAG: cation-translocating P-type ATPase, partial [Dehalococcoidia bacterium]
TELGDRTSMLFQGTLVARGRGRAIVVRTGASTEMGRIAGLVAAQRREDTPLQRELAGVGRMLAGIAIGLAVVVFVVAVIRGLPAGDMFVTAASLAVAAIPEGLPAASTIVLTLGVQRMARRHVIVRRLSSVETLGAVTIIFTDKTGTLTRNRMSVTEVAPAEDLEDDLLRAMVLCNNASLGEDGARDTGDPTEVALLAHAAERGVVPAELAEQYHRELEFPFEAKRARMTVVVTDSRGRRVAYTKGAPEVILARSTHPDGWVEAETVKQAAQAKSTAMAERGIRVLAFARRELGGEVSEDDIETGFSFLGLVGLADPLRAEAASSVRLAQDAGIQVAMLTGDQPATARSIGRQVGLVGPVIHGRDIEDLPAAQLRERIAEAPVFARVTSDHKLRIVEAARAQGHVVAMTGDGVNDAPALQAADIGIAMGAVGTDVAREASDMVLTDDNFHSIVVAVEEGRTIHANISRFIHFLLSCNAAEVGVVFLVLLFFGESVFTPLQILFVNLLTDGLPALALGVEPAEPGVLRRGPRPRERRLISQHSLVPIGVMGALIGLTTIAGYVIGRQLDGPDLPASLAFATLVGSQLSSSLVFRSETLPFVRLARNTWLLSAIAASALVVVLVFVLPVTRDAFDLAALTPGQWLTVIGLSLIPLVLGEATKLVLARRRDTAR